MAPLLVFFEAREHREFAGDRGAMRPGRVDRRRPWLEVQAQARLGRQTGPGRTRQGRAARACASGAILAPIAHWLTLSMASESDIL